ncbi:MAG: hypothetical protein E7509_05585 [Ruminococcus sp.]|nr:hypothetical protein [Ruminococcus sp.]
MKKALIIICMGSVLLAGCGATADSEKNTTTKATTTTTGQVLENLGDSTTTTTKKVEGAIIIGDNTTTTQSTTTIPEKEEPIESDEIKTTTTTAKVEVEKPAGSFSKSDAVIEVNSVKIKPDADFSGLKSSLGEPDEEFSSPSCLYDGDDKTFIYGGVTIYTYPSGSKDKVLEVEVASGNAKTPKGLKIGLSVEEVKAIYGSGDFDGNSFEYVDGNLTLYVMIENEKVTSFGVFTE